MALGPASQPVFVCDGDVRPCLDLGILRGTLEEANLGMGERAQDQDVVGVVMLEQLIEEGW